MANSSGKTVANTEVTTIEEWEKEMDNFTMDRPKPSVVEFGEEECSKEKVSINSQGAT